MWSIPLLLLLLPCTCGLSVKENLSRRNTISFLTASGLTFSTQQASNAFENKISNKYDDKPKVRGPQPKDNGIRDRFSISLESERTDYVGLKGCGAAPNCFSSGIPLNDDAEHSIPAFEWPSSMNQAEAMESLRSAVMKYPPGQQGVDGGGFDIKQYDPKSGYMYVQFEALKRGYIDDVEFAVLGGDRTVQVRSSSRIGYLDLGVNGKRLNCLAKILRDNGWKAEGVDYETHPGYKLENGF